MADEMTNLRVLRPPADDGPSLSGKAECGACGKEWEATAPLGTTLLECPGCKRMWGSFSNAVEPDVALWRCDCGEQLFWITPVGCMCRRCGTIQNGYD